MVTTFAALVLLMFTLLVIVGVRAEQKKPSSNGALAIAICTAFWAYALVVLIHCVRTP